MLTSLRSVYNAYTTTNNSVAWQFQRHMTFILKRKWEARLQKDVGQPKKLRAKHFVYDFIENNRRKEIPDIILTQYVEGVGSKGEVVSVKEAIYNKLLLSGEAVFNTKENSEKITLKQKEDTHSSPYANRTINMLNTITLAVVMNKEQPWTIEPWHIRVSLRKTGFYCDDSCIELPHEPIKGPDLEKENCDFFVWITVNNTERTLLKCRIHHWSTNPTERLPYVFEHWKMQTAPLFSS